CDDPARDCERADELLGGDGSIAAIFGAHCGVDDRGGTHDLFIRLAALERAREFACSLRHGARWLVLSRTGPPFAAFKRSRTGNRCAGRLGQCARTVGFVRYPDRLGGICLVALLWAEYRVAIHF